MLKRAHWFAVGGVALIVPLAGVLHAGCQPTCTQDSECPSGTFCFLGPGQCAQPVPLGFCTDISEKCTAAAVPVCGCDNNTYVNACAASQHGQSAATMAACVPSPCGSASDPCPKGQFCQFTTTGTCQGQGVAGSCVVSPLTCQDTFQPVCGCDGKTYRNLCEMQKAGVSQLAPTGCSCQDNSQCGADQFCSFAIIGVGNVTGCLATAPVGACSPRPTSCSQLQQLVCGCDGNTYTNACIASQAGVNVALSGACTAAVLPDGGADGGDAGDGG